MVWGKAVSVQGRVHKSKQIVRYMLKLHSGQQGFLTNYLVCLVKTYNNLIFRNKDYYTIEMTIHKIFAKPKYSLS